MNRGYLLAGLAGLLVGGSAIAYATGQFGSGGSGKARVEQIVQSYLLEHPEIIPQAMQRLQDRELGKVVTANRAAFETPYAGAWAGAEDADVVLVEFFDYACGYCRRSNADIDRLLAEDKKLKVVWRELPVLGPDSEAAAAVSLAAAKQGKFKAFYDKLFASGRPTSASLADAQRSVGITAAPNQAEVRSEVTKNYELARAINATGTPAFIVGDKVFQGAVGYEALKKAIAETRAAKTA